GGVAVCAALTLGGAVALFAAGWALLLPALVALVVVLLLAATARSKIGGQTGDILGAAQQLSEIVLLLGLAAQI
ncbi:adenosylcobinamide-GDP ribazoletransferase, partial [Pseudooceanicola lipolyticus]